MCWAYQTGLLRQGDLHTAYDDDMDYQTACLLIYRYAAMSGVDTRVDQELARQAMRGNSRLSVETVRAMLWCDQTDITGIFNQASVLYMYRNGYIDPETPNTFGGKAAAKVGEFVDVLYRISQRPETDNTALPPDYENEAFNGSACP